MRSGTGRFAMLLAAGVLGLSSSLLAGCGDRSRLIPAQAAAELDSDLQRAADGVAEEQCRQAQRAVAEAIAHAQDLDESVAPSLRENLERGLAHVSDRVNADCGRKTTATTPTTPTATTPTQTTTETTPPTPPPTQTTPPPSTTPRGPGNGGTSPGGGDRGEDGGESGGSDGNGTGGSGSGGSG